MARAVAKEAVGVRAVAAMTVATGKEEALLEASQAGPVAACRVETVTEEGKGGGGRGAAGVVATRAEATVVTVAEEVVARTPPLALAAAVEVAPLEGAPMVAHGRHRL